MRKHFHIQTCPSLPHPFLSNQDGDGENANLEASKQDFRNKWMQSLFFGCSHKQASLHRLCGSLWRFCANWKKKTALLHCWPKCERKQFFYNFWCNLSLHRQGVPALCTHYHRGACGNQPTGRTRASSLAAGYKKTEKCTASWNSTLLQQWWRNIWRVHKDNNGEHKLPLRRPWNRFFRGEWLTFNE